MAGHRAAGLAAFCAIFICANAANAVDCNTNGTQDQFEWAVGDCNSNHTLDVCEAGFRDCNTNGRNDACDNLADCDTNQTLDLCQTTRVTLSASPNSSLLDLSTRTATLNVAGSGAVSDVQVSLTIRHTWDSDLIISLSHAAATATLSNRAGGNGDNYTSTVFDDINNFPIGSGAAPFTGTFRPFQPLSVFTGLSSAGLWTLSVTDVANLDTGTLLSWQLVVLRGSPDCNTNGTPDVCELAGHDCNNNQTLDACDLASGQSLDGNFDGTPDECQFVGTDCNTDGIIDSNELNSFNDCNGNGTLDACEFGFVDCNTNGIADPCDIGFGFSIDGNFNGIPDECEATPGDCNTNGIPDMFELFGRDCNFNNTLDVCEFNYSDCNTNGTADFCEFLADCNFNGSPDMCEPFLPDCNTISSRTRATSFSASHPTAI